MFIQHSTTARTENLDLVKSENRLAVKVILEMF